jgi:FMN phosphatase YigB (HAD superfamily)
MNDVSHLLFDLDGTLLGSSKFSLRADFVARTIFYLMKRGYAPWISIRALHEVSRALAESSTRVLNAERAEKAFSLALGLSPDKGARALRGLVEESFPRLKKHFWPVPEAASFVEWARPRFRISLATNPVWPEEIVRLRLAWAQIPSGTFEDITHGECMHACKPSPEYYEEVLSRIGQPASRCLLIGDSEKKDLPAVEKGIRVFLLGPDPEPVGIRPFAWRGNFNALKKLLSEP